MMTGRPAGTLADRLNIEDPWQRLAVAVIERAWFSANRHRSNEPLLETSVIWWQALDIDPAEAAMLANSHHQIEQRFTPLPLL